VKAALDELQNDSSGSESCTSDSCGQLIHALSSEEDAKKLAGLSSYLGVTIIRKGKHDMVATAGSDVVVVLEDDGSPRRCGGQGDVLSGLIGVALGWADKVRFVRSPYRERTKCWYFVVETKGVVGCGGKCTPAASLHGCSVDRIRRRTPR
jgi:NAD(P)H-hydrate repair Nnr-like enzyme with NAD(P)H-hydrate dehydratase domain